MQRACRNGRCTRAFNHRGRFVDHFDIKVSRAEGHIRAIRFDQHIGQDRDGVAAFDHRLRLRHGLKQGATFNADFHPFVLRSSRG